MRPDNTCAVEHCDRPAYDAHVCRGCGNRLIADLSACPDIADDLDVAITRQAVFGPRVGEGRSAEHPLPVDLWASDVKADLRATLARWVKRVCDERRIPCPPNADITATSAWLRSRVQWLRSWDTGAAACQEIGNAVERARRHIDSPPPRVYAGPCDGRYAVERTDACPCWHEVYAPPGAAGARCGNCRTTYAVQARRDAMRVAAEDLLGTAQWCAMVCTGLGVPLPASTVRSWIRRHKLESRGTIGGAPAYKVGDVLALAKAGERRSPGAA